MNIKQFIQSQTFLGIIIGMLVVIAGLVIFQIGVSVGEQRSNFAHRYSDTFERNFRGPESGIPFIGLPGDGPLPSGHGAVGEVISIVLPNIVVAGPDNLEKTIVVGPQTVIREFQTERTIDDLEIGDHIIALGEPNDEGLILARLIRLLPPPPDFGSENINE